MCGSLSLSIIFQLCVYLDKGRVSHGEDGEETETMTMVSHTLSLDNLADSDSRKSNYCIYYPCFQRVCVCVCVVGCGWTPPAELQRSHWSRPRIRVSRRDHDRGGSQPGRPPCPHSLTSHPYPPLPYVDVSVCRDGFVSIWG